MERKEAIEILKSTMIKFKTFENGQEFLRFFDALEMAISSLEADEAYQLEYERTTKNDLGVDYISREQALRELKESAEHHANDSREEVLLRRDRDIIRALPSVTPQEPTNKDLTCAYAKGVYDTREETATIFDKIRAEIETEKLEDSPNFCIKAHNNAVDRVLQILDKYKTDRSEEDGNEINCPYCPYYEQTTSYGTELIKCNNTDCKRRVEDGNDTY